MATTDFGFDFRATSGFVTDPNYAAPVIIEAFPNTYTNGLSNTISAGWTNNSFNGDADRNSGNDARLAGINYVNNGSSNMSTFRVTLPSTGTWTIVLAAGDTSGAQIQCVQLFDNVTSIASYQSVNTAGNSFMDANGTVWTEANWVTSNTTLTYTFASTTFNVTCGTASAVSSATCLAHLRVTLAPSGTIYMLGHL
jgi:hypothetical protein